MNLMPFAAAFSPLLFSSAPNLSLLPFTLSQSCQKGLFLLDGKFLEVGVVKNTHLSVMRQITDSKRFPRNACILEDRLNMSGHQAVLAVTWVCQWLVSSQSNIFLVYVSCLYWIYLILCNYSIFTKYTVIFFKSQSCKQSSHHRMKQQL